MTYLLLVLLLLAIGVAVFMWKKAVTANRDSNQLRAVVDSQHDYAFLVNRQLEVQQTNFRSFHQRQDKHRPKELGNVLHCKNAFEAGRCGEHDDCGKCPLRFVIRKSFERHEDFSDVEACMELYDDNHKNVDIDVQVDGRIVTLGPEPHMVVNVKPSADGCQHELPKVLFISENVALYDKVRVALDKKVRVLSADNLHQALHRLLLAQNYKFLAVMIDEKFYAENSEVTKLLVENDGITVIVFTSEYKQAGDGHVSYMSEDFTQDELCLFLLKKKTEQE